MPNLYIADDGTIHDRNIGHCQRVVSGNTTTGPTSYATPDVGAGRKIAFWLITIAMAVLIGSWLYSTAGTAVFEKVNEPDGVTDHVMNFFCSIAPFVIVGGSVIGAILYGTTHAADQGYNLGTYFLSALSAAGGTVGTGIALFLLAFFVSIALALLAVVIIISIIIAAFGGS